MAQNVSMIGCGLMGSALAQAFHRAGSPVTGTDLDSARLEALAEHGITTTADLTEAVRAGELVVVSVPVYSIVFGLLEAPHDMWAGKTILNLVTGTPDEAQRCKELAESQGARYLDGAIFTYPSNIGGPDAMVLISGATEVWDEFSGTLQALGAGTTHVGPEIEVANVIDVAMAGAFYSAALGAFAEAAAYVKSNGVDIRVAMAAARREADQLRADLDEVCDAIASDQFETNDATLDVFLEACEAWYSAMLGSGNRARIMGGLVENLRDAHSDGLGGLGFFAQVRSLSTDASKRN